MFSLTTQVHNLRIGDFFTYDRALYQLKGRAFVQRDEQSKHELLHSEDGSAYYIAVAEMTGRIMMIHGSATVHVEFKTKEQLLAWSMT